MATSTTFDAFAASQATIPLVHGAHPAVGREAAQSMRFSERFGIRLWHCIV